MKNRRQNRRNSGFTVVEMLAVVAIMIILMAVSAVSVISYMDKLTLTELDNAAREIYLAAENRAVLIGPQRVNKLSAAASPLAAAEDEEDGGSADESKLSFAANAGEEKISTDLLPTGSIDPTLLDGYFYIVYEDGSVVAVLYAEDSMEGVVTDVVDFAKKSYSDRLKENVLVGVYTGDPAQSGNFAPEETQGQVNIIVTILNEEKLILGVTVTYDSDAADAVKTALDIENNGVDSKLEVRLGTPTGKNDLNGDNSIKLALPTLPEELSMVYAEGGGSYIYTWVLDSLEQGADGKYLHQFKNIAGSGVAPGADFQVTANFVGKITFDVVSNTSPKTSNSLFAEGSNKDSNSGEALIANLRHLQNLHTEFSGVNGTTTTITSAVQTAAIEGVLHEDDGVNTTTYNFAPITNDKLTKYDGQSKEIKNLTVSGESNVGLFGQNFQICTIQNVIMVDGEISGTGKNIGGIVGLNDGALLNCSYSGSVTGTKVDGNDNSGKNVGGLVGWNRSATPLDGSNGNLSTANVSGNENVGGIVGLNTTYVQPDSGPEAADLEVAEPGTVTRVATVQNFTRTSTNGTVTGTKNVGGIVGSNGDAYDNGKADDGTHAAVLNCRNEGVVGEEGKGNRVGGVVGHNNGKLGFANDTDPGEFYCSNTGKVYGNDRVGGVVGSIESAGEVRYCFNVGVITGGTNVGGVAGYVTNTNEGEGEDAKSIAEGKMQYCYNIAEVNGNTNVGGVAGRSSGIVSDCYNDGKVTGNTYVGGVLGRKFDTGELKNCYNTGSVSGSANVGGVVGNHSGDNKANESEVKNCYYLDTCGAEDKIANKLKEKEFSEQKAGVSFDGWDFEKDGVSNPVWTLICPGENTRDKYGNIAEPDDGHPTWRPILVDLAEEVKEPKAITLSALVYYEVYTDTSKTYGLHGYLVDKDGTAAEVDTLKTENTDHIDSRNIADYGYALAVLKDGTTDGLTVTVMVDGNPVAIGDKLTEKPIEYTNNSTNTTYTFDLYKLPYEDVPENFYAKLTIREGDEANSYYFNPHFAKTVKLGGTADGYAALLKSTYKGNDAESAIIRTAGQLDNLRAQQAYYNGQYKFLQELNLVLDSSNYGDGSASNRVHAPIGPGASTAAFNGLYDGGTYNNGGKINHTISGLSISASNSDYQGLFGYSTGTIQNVDVSGSVTGTNRDFVGGIVGSNNGGTVLNCSYSGTVSGGTTVGGIAGFNSGEVSGCKITTQLNNNEHAVSGTNNVGGIVGNNGAIGKVTGCENLTKGDQAVYGNASVGGIAGNNVGTVENCYNKAEGEQTVYGTGSQVGGIVGANNGKNGVAKVTGCENLAKVAEGQSDTAAVVQGKQSVGGIVGASSNGGTVESCDNKGTVSGTSSVGGVVGSITNEKDEKTGQETNTKPNSVYNCANSGNITAEKDEEGISNVGGIVGSNNKYGTVDGNTDSSANNKTNSGTVSGTGSQVGGIVGNNNGGVVKNYDNADDGDVTGYQYVGGVVGYNHGDKAKVNTCYNSASVTATCTEADFGDSKGAFVGGIVGGNDGDDTAVANCTNSGAVEASVTTGDDSSVKTINYVGGVVGYNVSGTVSTSYNIGNISGNQYVGGIVGYSKRGTVLSCYSGYEDANTTKDGVTVTGYQYVGGIVGYNDDGTENHIEVNKCYNNASVTAENTGDAHVGGIVGENSGSDTTVAYSKNYGAVMARSGTTYGKRVGGVVGYNNSGTVEQCSNEKVTDNADKGTVKGAEQVGGVVGRSGQNGTVKNCHNTGAVEGEKYVGGVEGQTGGPSYVVACYNTGTVTGGSNDSKNVGGVVGQLNSGAWVTGCYNTGKVTGGTDSIGGVAGNVSEQATVLNSYNTGEVSAASGKNVGGVAGQVTVKPDTSSNGKVTNCYNIGVVTGASGSTGGVVGTGTGTATSCYYLKDDNYNSGLYGIGGATEDPDGAKSKEAKAFGFMVNFAGWAESTDGDWDTSADKSAMLKGPMWQMCIDIRSEEYTPGKDNKGQSLPNGFPDYRPGIVSNLEYWLTPGEDTGENPEAEPDEPEIDYDFDNIHCGHTLKEFKDAVESGRTGATGRVTKNFDIYEVCTTDGCQYKGKPAFSGNWVPIGIKAVYAGSRFTHYETTDSFTGVLEGDGHTITGLYIYDNQFGNQMYIGLFAKVGQNGVIRNLNVEGTVAQWNSNTGGIAGYNEGTVKNCSFKGDINGTNNVGGVVGQNTGTGIVENCYYTGGTITTNGTDVGGVVGKNSGAVQNCYNSGTVNGQTNARVGGVVGSNSGVATNEIFKGVRYCHNFGSVTGGASVGGVLGSNSGTVQNCYYLGTGTISGTSDFGQGIGGNEDDDGKTEAKDSDDFSDGTLTNLLNNGQSKKPWKTKDGIDYPVLKDVGEGKDKTTTGNTQSGDTIVAALPPDRKALSAFETSEDARDTELMPQNTQVTLVSLIWSWIRQIWNHW